MSAPSPPPSATLLDHGGGLHTVALKPAPEPGEWLKLELDVSGARRDPRDRSGRGGTALLTVWVAHQPLDINGDGVTDIQDATAFGTNFGGSKDVSLIAVNCDGTVNVQDATTFGTNWNAGWANTELPPKP